MTDHTEVPEPGDTFNFAHHLLEANAARPDKAAFVDDHGSLSYGELAVQVRQMASALLIGKGLCTALESRPMGITSRAVGFTWARCSTSARGTPVHSATPMPPRFQGVPSMRRPWDCWKKFRPLPAHSIARITEIEGIARRST